MLTFVYHAKYLLSVFGIVLFFHNSLHCKIFKQLKKERNSLDVNIKYLILRGGSLLSCLLECLKHSAEQMTIAPLHFFSLTLTDFSVNYEKTEEDSSNIDISLKER
jgi:hypothetical protein